MNEKIILENPNGETEERNVICHFKSMSDDKPNIKNVPVLVLDKNEMNNGNKVLEFLWEKDGIYQAINDDAAWSEVKSVFVDMIKNNLDVNTPKEEFLVLPSVKVALGGGRPLAVNDVQVSTLVNNVNTFKVQLQNNQEIQQNSITEAPAMENVAPTVVSQEAMLNTEMSSPISETPVMSESVSEVPVNDTPVDAPVMPMDVPEASVAPVQDSINMEMPTTESPVVPEIAPVIPEEASVTNETPVTDSPVETPVMETPEIPVQESVNMEMPTVESPVVPDIASVMPEEASVINETPVIDTPVIETPEAPVIPNVVPDTNEASVMDATVETPVIDTPEVSVQDNASMEMPTPTESPAGVEIIENEKEDNNLLKELETIHEKYNEQRKMIDEEEEKEISAFFQRHSEEMTQKQNIIQEQLKNAEAVTEIARQTQENLNKVNTEVGTSPVQGDPMTLGLEKAA